MEDLVPEAAIDNAEVFRRRGADLGDEDFAFFRCPRCRRVYLVEYEVGTVYPAPADLGLRLPVSDQGFTCVGCGLPISGGEAWVGAAARREFGVTWADLVAGGWEWAARRG